MSELSHLDAQGRASMVDVGDKDDTDRSARAHARVVMNAETLAMITRGEHPKGDVFATARIAGIQAAKKAWELIPLCHPLMLSSVRVDIRVEDEATLVVETLCRVRGPTGVEMETLTAASVAALTIYDMCKAVDRGMRIGPVELLEKAGGASGEWKRES